MVLKPPRQPLDRRALLASLLGAARGSRAGRGRYRRFGGAGLFQKIETLGPGVVRSTRSPDGGVTTVQAHYDRKSGFYTERVSLPVLVSRNANELICFSAACPHLGCTVRWDGNASRFRCACHGGTFDRDGMVIAGPPPRPLDRYAFKIDAGQLLVEVG